MNIAPATNSRKRKSKGKSVESASGITDSGVSIGSKSGSNPKSTTYKRRATIVKQEDSQKSVSNISGTNIVHGGVSINSSSGHRPVTSCTHCRQHKIRCNASDNYPNPCHRCERMGLVCEIDPQFRPKKGSQIQSLRNDVDELKAKLDLLRKNESLIAKALLENSHLEQLVDKQGVAHDEPRNNNNNNITSRSPSATETQAVPTVAQTFINKESPLIRIPFNKNDIPEPTVSDVENSSIASNSIQIKRRSITPSNEITSNKNKSLDSVNGDFKEALCSNNVSPNLNIQNITEFTLGDVCLPIEKANELHKRFLEDYLPFLPIMTSNSASELYSQSQLLFWTVCLTACLSDSDPTLYNKLASLIKQLAIETCWIRTPRSTHIVQSLLILSIWPLPNQKVLDDCSYRFVGLAKNLGFQLGLHRGKFISEFSRTQVSLVNAEKWRTRTWLFVFFCEQLWASILGLPPSIQTDYLVENARVDTTLPPIFRCLICLSIFQSKLFNIMGSSVTSPDGLMSAKNRAGSLNILIRELERLIFKINVTESPITEMYYLYVKLLICNFAFLPETPTEDQAKYVTLAFHAATRIVTIFSKLIEVKQLSEYPIYIRNSVTFACFTLFKLILTQLLLDKYVDSARQSVVTVHRLYRNMLASWQDVDNDISRTAKVLENLNYVILTQPSVFLEGGDGIIKRNRSHLSNSLFYDLVSCIHEAARRNKQQVQDPGYQTLLLSKERSILVPLPFYNQITKDNFKTITTTSPNGTTMTKLVPTKSAMSTAKADALANGLSGPMQINGIPLPLLEVTGSLSSVENQRHDLKTVNKDIHGTAEQTFEKSQVGLNKATASLVDNSSSNVLNAGVSRHNEKQGINTAATSSTGSFNINSSNKSEVAARVSVSNEYGVPNTMILPTVEKYVNYEGFFTNGNNNGSNPVTTSNPTDAIDNNDPLHGETGQVNSLNSVYGLASSNPNTTNDLFGNFLQQQSSRWNDTNDDFLGWFDVNMAPEF